MLLDLQSPAAHAAALLPMLRHDVLLAGSLALCLLRRCNDGSERWVHARPSDTGLPSLVHGSPTSSFFHCVIRMRFSSTVSVSMRACSGSSRLRTRRGEGGLLLGGAGSYSASPGAAKCWTCTLQATGTG